MISNRICNRIVTLSSVVLLCGATTGVFAQSSMGSGQNGSSNSSMSSSSSMSSNKASMADKKFVKKAMEMNMAEVQLGQMAADKGGAQDVKQFGQKMVTDHTKLNDQLKPIAQQCGIVGPTSLNAKNQALMSKLQGESGDQFDKTYIKSMVKGHSMALKGAKSEAAHGKDDAVKDAASQAAQVISGHLSAAEHLAQVHNVSIPKGMKGMDQDGMNGNGNMNGSGTSGTQAPQGGSMR